MSNKQLQHGILDVLALDKSSEHDWSQGYLRKLNTATSTLYHASLNKVKLRNDEEPARAHICAYIACERLVEKGYRDADNKKIQYFMDRIPLPPKHVHNLLAIFKQQIFQLSPVKSISWSPSPKKKSEGQSPVKNGDRFSARDPKELRAELFGTPSREQRSKLSPTKRMVPTPTVTDSVLRNKSPGKITAVQHDGPALTPRRKLTFEEVDQEDETTLTVDKESNTPHTEANGVSPSRSIFKSAERLRGSPLRAEQQLESRNLSKALVEANSEDKEEKDTSEKPLNEERGEEKDGEREKLGVLVGDNEVDTTSNKGPQIEGAHDSNENIFQHQIKSTEAEAEADTEGEGGTTSTMDTSLDNTKRPTTIHTHGKRNRPRETSSSSSSSKRKRLPQNGGLLTKRFCKATPAEIIKLCNAFELPRDVAFKVLDQYLIDANYIACPWQLACGLVMNVVFIVFNEKRSKDPRVDYWLLERMAKLMSCPLEDEILTSIDLVKELIVSETWYRQLQVQYNYFDGSSYKETILTNLGSMLQPKNILVTDEQFKTWKRRVEQDLSLRNDNA